MKSFKWFLSILLIGLMLTGCRTFRDNEHIDIMPHDDIKISIDKVPEEIQINNDHIDLKPIIGIDCMFFPEHCVEPVDISKMTTEELQAHLEQTEADTKLSAMDDSAAGVAPDTDYLYIASTAEGKSVKATPDEVVTAFLTGQSISLTELSYIDGLDQTNSTTSTPTFAGLTVAASAAPGYTMNDSDDAAGTGHIYANSSGGVNDIILSIGVEDSNGENQPYIQFDGVDEVAKLLYPTTLQAGDIELAEMAANSVDSTQYVDDSIDAEHIASYTLSPIILAEPDELQPIADAWPLYQFLAETYPSGVTITSIHISTSATCTDDMNFEEWSNNGTAWSVDSTVEAITLSGTHTEDDGTLADADIAADAWLYVDLDAAPTDIASYSIVISFTSQ